MTGDPGKHFGYITLTQFAQDSAHEMRNAIVDLLDKDVLAPTTTADPPVIMRSEDGRRLERTCDGFRLRGAD
jgi:hypothetical protein